MSPIRAHRRHRILALLLLAGLLALAGCHDRPTGPGAGVDLESFKALARQSDCADLRNRLFLIDGVMVFWDRAGQCPDASYALTLYGSSVERVLCRAMDSVAGPMKDCRAEPYAPLFETILAHTNEPDLGLGRAHTVQPIAF